MSEEMRFNRCKKLDRPIRLLLLVTAVYIGTLWVSNAPPLHGKSAEEPRYQLFLPRILHQQAPKKIDGDLHDMVDYLAGPVGNMLLYEVQHSNGPQTRHQTQVTFDRFFHTKGEIIGEWEELWYDDDYIYRGTDTSPGAGRYYTLRQDGYYGSPWAPRYWRVGEEFLRDPLVTFYNKSDCQPREQGQQTTWLRFDAYYPSYTFASGITLNDVVQFSWLLNQVVDGKNVPVEPPIEQYFYARGYGLVGWDGGTSFFYSYISEIHQPFTRPDNPREEISCLSTTGYTPAENKLLPSPFLWAK
jgi:hypothetical protein